MKVFFLYNKAYLLIYLRVLNWNKRIAPKFLLDAQVPPEPGTEQLTAPWIRNLRLFDSFLELQDVELRCKCPSVPSPKMSIFGCTKKKQRSD